MRKHSLALILGLVAAAASSAGQGLESRFLNPPEEARPWVFYFFENDVMDPPGITSDLEALKAVGVGGLIVFSEDRPDMKVGNVKMFSREYNAGMQHLLKEAGRLGLLVSLFDGAGSATAGGPWNAVEHSMKQFTWSETPVAGGGPRTLQLKQPLTLYGFYRDIAVTAYPATPAKRLDTEPAITAPQSKGNTGEMMDGNILTKTLFQGHSQQDRCRIQLEYPEPVTVGRLFVYGNLYKYGPDSSLDYDLEVSEEGRNWRNIATVRQKGNNPAVADFPSVTGKYFRILASTRPENFWIAELDLLPPGGRPRSYPQFNDWAASTGREGGAFQPLKPVLLADDKPLDPARAVDLTSRLQPNGSLAWDAPPGEWLVLRMGCTTTGQKNHPTTGEGLGFEVDKFDPALVRRHAEEALQHMSGGNPGIPSLKMFHVDSWEAGGQTWTENLAAEFEKRNGYSLLPFLPALAGRLVADADTTRRFLEDFRHTLQDLVAGSFYGTMREVSRKHGLSFLAESSAGAIPIHRPLDFFQYVDIPAGEAWALGNFSSAGTLCGGLRDAVSAAHLLGKPMTPVEVFTSNRGNWNMSPRFLKGFGDKILAAGGNQMTLHCYIHQPSTDPAPGWTMNHYGTTFNRHVTWWKQARPWLQSIARSQVLLREGRTVADFSRLLADDEMIANPDLDGWQTFWNAPDGYANDWMSADNLSGLFHAEDGEIVAAAGTARYRLLVLPEAGRMTLEAVRKLHELVEAGGVILGERPVARTGLRGGEAADREFAGHVDALWGSHPPPGERTVGKGRVLTGMTVDAALALLKVKPDLAWITPDTAPQLHWHHRRGDGRDIYFIANGGPNTLRASLSFRVANRRPEIWYPETGTIRHPAVYRCAGDRVELPVQLGPLESIFVVFASEADGSRFEDVARDGQSLWPQGKAPAKEFPGVWKQPDGKIVMETPEPGEYLLGNSRHLSVQPRPAPVELGGPWKISFDGVAAPKPQVLDQLLPLNQHPDPDVRFFSGTAIYRTLFDWKPETGNLNSEIILDLGEVRELAEVVLNGQPLGLVWKPPFRLNATGKLRPGKNEVAIRVVNTWANRLIGDAALPEADRHTWTSFVHYKKTDPLPDSGLLGPVRFVTTRSQQLPNPTE